MQAYKMAMDALKNEPVRCKDCKHFIKEEHGCDHHGYYYPVHVKDDDFCSYGERREGE